MFKLKNNNMLIDGTCSYIDEYGNRAFFTKREEGFSCKLRFSDKNIVADRVVVDKKKRDDGGAPLHLDYSSENIFDKEDVKAAIDGFKDLFAKWVDMIETIELAAAPYIPVVPIGEKEALSPEDLARFKMERLSEYEELRGSLSGLI